MGKENRGAEGVQGLSNGFELSEVHVEDSLSEAPFNSTGHQLIPGTI